MYSHNLIELIENHSKEAQKKCQTLIPTLIRFVNPETASWITIKATVGLIRNITNNKKNRTYLR